MDLPIVLKSYNVSLVSSRPCASTVTCSSWGILQREPAYYCMHELQKEHEVKVEWLSLVAKVLHIIFESTNLPCSMDLILGQFGKPMSWFVPREANVGTG